MVIGSEEEILDKVKNKLTLVSNLAKKITDNSLKEKIKGLESSWQSFCRDYPENRKRMTSYLRFSISDCLLTASRKEIQDSHEQLTINIRDLHVLFGNFLETRIIRLENWKKEEISTTKQGELENWVLTKQKKLEQVKKKLTEWVKLVGEREIKEPKKGWFW